MVDKIQKIKVHFQGQTSIMSSKYHFRRPCEEFMNPDRRCSMHCRKFHGPFYKIDFISLSNYLDDNMRHSWIQHRRKICLSLMKLRYKKFRRKYFDNVSSAIMINNRSVYDEEKLKLHLQTKPHQPYPPLRSPPKPPAFYTIEQTLHATKPPIHRKPPHNTYILQTKSKMSSILIKMKKYDFTPSKSAKIIELVKKLENVQNVQNVKNMNEKKKHLQQRLIYEIVKRAKERNGDDRQQMIQRLMNNHPQCMSDIKQALIHYKISDEDDGSDDSSDIQIGDGLLDDSSGQSLSSNTSEYQFIENENFNGFQLMDGLISEESVVDQNTSVFGSENEENVDQNLFYFSGRLSLSPMVTDCIPVKIQNTTICAVDDGSDQLSIHDVYDIEQIDDGIIITNGESICSSDISVDDETPVIWNKETLWMEVMKIVHKCREMEVNENWCNWQNIRQQLKKMLTANDWIFVKNQKIVKRVKLKFRQEFGSPRKTLNTNNIHTNEAMKYATLNYECCTLDELHDKISDIHQSMNLLLNKDICTTYDHTIITEYGKILSIYQNWIEYKSNNLKVVQQTLSNTASPTSNSNYYQMYGERKKKNGILDRVGSNPSTIGEVDDGLFINDNVINYNFNVQNVQNINNVQNVQNVQNVNNTVLYPTIFAPKTTEHLMWNEYNFNANDVHANQPVFHNNMRNNLNEYFVDTRYPPRKERYYNNFYGQRDIYPQNSNFYQNNVQNVGGNDGEFNGGRVNNRMYYGLQRNMVHNQTVPSYFLLLFFSFLIVCFFRNGMEKEK